MKLWPWLGLVALASLNVQCGKRGDLQEEINKLRPLGVLTNPIIAYPGQKVSVTYLAATPVGQTVTVAAYKPENLRLGDAPTPDLSYAKTTADKKDYAGLSLHEVTGEFVIPETTQAALVAGIPLRVRFGSQLKADNGQNVDVVSDIFIFDKEAPEIKQAKAPSSSITAPDTVGRDQEVEISGVIDDQSIDSSYKVGWFTSQGELKNRRAKTTKWKTPKEPGKHVLIFTARGKETKAFTYAVKEVTVN